jgi:Holliday junction resolvasome RuvABC DNA-binding subunit
MVLGYNSFEASNSVNSVFKEGMGVEEIIMKALKAISK